LRVLTAKKKFHRIKVRRSWRLVDWASASYALFTKSLVQVVVVVVVVVVVDDDGGSHVPRLMVNHS
jgi:hypothetical protein